MKTLKSHVCGAWHEAGGGFALLHDPCTEEPIAQAGSDGIDFGAALDFARRKGGSALRELNFLERGELLKGMSKVLHEHRDELIGLSLHNTGTTRRDAKFDLDGATGTELERRGVRSELPLWSAHALLECPDRVAEVHAEYVAAGAEARCTASIQSS